MPAEMMGRRVVVGSGGRPWGRLLTGPAVVVAIAAGLAGCGPAVAPPAATRSAAPADHDHDHEPGDAGHDHQHPQTLAAGAAQVEALWNRVREALAKGDRDAADDQVHEAGHLLEDLEGLVAGEKAEARESARKAVQEIFDGFEAIDAALHAGEDDWKKLDLDGIGAGLAAAFGRLKPAAKSEDN